MGNQTRSHGVCLVLWLFFLWFLGIWVQAVPHKSFEGDAKVYFIKSSVDPKEIQHAMAKPLYRTHINLRHLTTAKLVSLWASGQLPAPMVNYNSPLFKWLWSPLSRMDEKTAATIWFYVSLSGFLIGVCLLVIALPSSCLLSLPLSMLAALCLPMTFWSMTGGQVGGLVAFFVGLFVWLAARKRTMMVDLCLGVMTAFKYFFGLLVLRCVQGKPNRLLVVMASFILVLCLPQIFSPYSFGAHLKGFLGINGIALVGKTLSTTNMSLLALMARPWTPDMGPQFLSLPALICLYIVVACVLIFISIKKLTGPASRTHDQHPLRPIAALMLLAAIINPLFWPYYQPCVWPAMAFILLTLEQRRHPVLIAAIFLIFVVSIFYKDTTINFNETQYSQLFYAWGSFHNFWVSYGPGLCHFGILALVLSAPSAIKAHGTNEYKSVK